SPVVQRADETEEAIGKRLDTYHEKTAPLIGFYQKDGMLMNVDAASSEVVVDSIKQKLGMK
ncbi:MAG: adenylate kinase, partial [Candidatus Rokubacteria bacterium]|nr:adenylate kinase [Candidatus Rokubacteria bacterium]